MYILKSVIEKAIYTCLCFPGLYIIIIYIYTYVYIFLIDFPGSYINILASKLK